MLPGGSTSNTNSLFQPTEQGLSAVQADGEILSPSIVAFSTRGARIHFELATPTIASKMKPPTPSPRDVHERRWPRGTLSPITP